MFVFELGQHCVCACTRVYHVCYTCKGAYDTGMPKSIILSDHSQHSH